MSVQLFAVCPVEPCGWNDRTPPCGDPEQRCYHCLGDGKRASLRFQSTLYTQAPDPYNNGLRYLREFVID